MDSQIDSTLELLCNLNDSEASQPIDNNLESTGCATAPPITEERVKGEFVSDNVIILSKRNLLTQRYLYYARD